MTLHSFRITYHGKDRDSSEYRKLGDNTKTYGTSSSVLGTKTIDYLKFLSDCTFPAISSKNEQNWYLHNFRSKSAIVLHTLQGRECAHVKPFLYSRATQSETISGNSSNNVHLQTPAVHFNHRPHSHGSQSNINNPLTLPQSIQSVARAERFKGTASA